MSQNTVPFRPSGAHHRFETLSLRADGPAPRGCGTIPGRATATACTRRAPDSAGP